MNIYTCLKKARKLNRALRRKEWAEDLFVYHGMDNVLRWSDERDFSFSIADLLSTTWVTTKIHPYQRAIKSNV